MKTQVVDLRLDHFEIPSARRLVAILYLGRGSNLETFLPQLDYHLETNELSSFDLAAECVATIPNLQRDKGLVDIPEVIINRLTAYGEDKLDKEIHVTFVAILRMTSKLVAWCNSALSKASNNITERYKLDSQARQQVVSGCIADAQLPSI